MDDIAQGGRTEITPPLAAGVYIMSAILLKQSHLTFRRRRQTILKSITNKIEGLSPGGSS